MPDHFHLLLTPTETLEKAVQFIKGGFSFRARKELGLGGEIWEHSFYDDKRKTWRPTSRELRLRPDNCDLRADG